jgi:hypothetical protein
MADGLLYRMGGGGPVPYLLRCRVLEMGFAMPGHAMAWANQANSAKLRA